MAALVSLRITEVSTRKPTNWANAMTLGAIKMREGNLRAAAAAFATAASYDVERPEAWVNLAIANTQLGNMEAAERATAKALALNADYAPALRSMGDINRSKGDLEAAATCYQKACQSNPEPLTLNNYATILRTLGDMERAEALYLEAERIAPNFSLPRVNRAILQIERGRFDEAKTQLQALDSMPLNPHEREHQQSALLCLSERARLEPVLQRLEDSGNTSELEKALRATTARHLEVDRYALEPIENWVSELYHAQKEIEPANLLPLPGDWHEIEATHMIPIVSSPEEFRDWQTDHSSLGVTDLERIQTERMIPAIEAASTVPLALASPTLAEAQLRQLHALCTKDVELAGLFPGRFKYTQSSSRNHPTARHVIPSKAQGTFRAACDLLNDTPAGLGRAVVLFLTVCSLHPFGDANGRVGMTLMNRELIACGLMPAIFSMELGNKGQFGEAEEYAHRQGSLLPLLYATVAGQRYATTFLSALVKVDKSP